jgi:hypothetical protein
MSVGESWKFSSVFKMMHQNIFQRLREYTCHRTLQGELIATITTGHYMSEVYRSDPAKEVCASVAFSDYVNIEHKTHSFDIELKCCYNDRGKIIPTGDPGQSDCAILLSDESISYNSRAVTVC